MAADTMTVCSIRVGIMAGPRIIARMVFVLTHTLPLLAGAATTAANVTNERLLKLFANK